MLLSLPLGTSDLINDPTKFAESKFFLRNEQ